MSRNSRKCEICEKTEYGTYKEKLFYAAFPMDEVRCREWLRLVGNSKLVYLPIKKLHKNRFVCGNHFERKALNKKGNRLKKNAIPKLNLRFPPLTEHELREFSQHMRSSKKEISTSGEASKSFSKTKMSHFPQASTSATATESLSKSKRSQSPQPSVTSFSSEKAALTPRKQKLIKKLKISQIEIKKSEEKGGSGRENFISSVKEPD